jgi:hypothetical protein
MHLVVSSGLQLANATESDNAFVADPTIPRNSANHLLLPGAWAVYMVYALSANLSRVRLAASRLRQNFLPYVWPFDRAAAPPTRPNLCDFRSRPIPLAPNDELEIDVSHTNGGASEQVTVGVWLSQGLDPIPAGKPVFPIRCAAAITGVANAWASGPLVFGQTLPPGNWGVTNMQVQSATGIFARLIFPGAGNNTRPGVICSSALNINNGFEGRHEPFGLMGQFSNFAPPQLEIFCTGADTAQVVHLDLVPLS